MGWRSRHRSFVKQASRYRRQSMDRSIDQNSLFRPVSFLISILLLSVTISSVCSTSTLNQDPTYGKDTSGQSSAWQYAQQSAASPTHHEKTYEGGHHYGHVGTRQGALIGSPLYGVFPIIFLIGLAAIIIIPLLFFTFSPYGFAGGYGQSAFAKKRSLLDEWDGPSLKKNLLDLIVTVSEAIEKYGGPFLAEQANLKAKKKS